LLTITISLCAVCSQIYGLSEATGPITYGLPSQYRFGSAGKVFDGIEVKYLDQDTSGEGELCFRGRSLFLGYLGDPDSSAEAFDADGFFHTGDRGKSDGDGFLFVTGRTKELLKTSGGENVAPLLIDEALTEAMPAVSRAVAVGDNRKFISCLLIPHMNDAGELVGLAKDLSADAQTGTDAAASAEWRVYVSRGIEAANKCAISGVAKVKRFTLLTRNFTIDPPGGAEEGELTPTFKLRRKVVERTYASEIEAMYASTN
jgi:long-subunit acyl-CoA synthetase (AMP-forming)